MQGSSKLVFISYSDRDASVADNICHRLEESGIPCWIAPRDITPGLVWGDAIIEAINLCKVMVIVFSSQSNSSNQVLREVERAVSKGRMIIIPFKIENISPSKAMEYFLSTQHWLEAVAPPIERHIEELSKTVQSIFRLVECEKRQAQPWSRKEEELKELGAVINAAHAEEITEFIMLCKEALRDCGYESLVSADTACVLSELLSNSAEHGCQYDPKKKIRASFKIFRSNVNIVVRDNGKGFDPQVTIGKLGESEDIRRERGRGLLIVKSLCRRIHFSASGRKVEVVITNRKDPPWLKDMRSYQGKRVLGDIAILTLPEEPYFAINDIEDEIEMRSDQCCKHFAVDWGLVRATPSDLMTWVVIGSLHKIVLSGRYVVFFNLSPAVYRSLKKFRINEMFPIKNTLQDALGHINMLRGPDDNVVKES